MGVRDVCEVSVCFVLERERGGQEPMHVQLSTLQNRCDNFLHAFAFLESQKRGAFVIPIPVLWVAIFSRRVCFCFVLPNGPQASDACCDVFCR